MFVLGMGIVCFGPKAVRGFRISQVLGPNWGMLFSAASHTHTHTLSDNRGCLNRGGTLSVFGLKRMSIRRLVEEDAAKWEQGTCEVSNPSKMWRYVNSTRPGRCELWRDSGSYGLSCRIENTLCHRAPISNKINDYEEDAFNVVVVAGNLIVRGCEEKVGWPPGWYIAATKL